jgi:phage gp45-like
MINDIINTISNIFKFGNITNIKSENGKLQEIQLKSLRGVEYTKKMGFFGFNSKPPLDSRALILRVSDEKITLATEHEQSIKDISFGNVIIYNQAGDTIKIENGVITITASTKLVVNAPLTQFNGDIEATGDIVSQSGTNNISLSTHTHITNHGGGSSHTEPPTPTP